MLPNLSTDTTATKSSTKVSEAFQCIDDCIDDAGEKLQENLETPLHEIQQQFPVTQAMLWNPQDPQLEQYLQQIHQAFKAISESSVSEDGNIPGYAEFAVNQLLLWVQNVPDTELPSTQIAIFKILEIPKIRPSQDHQGQLFFVLLKQWPTLSRQSDIERRVLKLFVRSLLPQGFTTSGLTKSSLSDFLLRINQQTCVKDVLSPALSACSDPSRLLQAISKAIQKQIPETGTDHLSDLFSLPNKLRELRPDFPQLRYSLNLLANEIDKRIPEEYRCTPIQDAFSVPRAEALEFI